MNKCFMRTSVFIFIIVLALLSDSLYAMSWPSINAVLVHNFGANNRGQPVLGMVFAGGTEVLAAENGEVIFSRSKNDPASRLPSPLGAWTAIDHGDGLIGIYSRYADTPSAAPDRFQGITQVEKGQPIASAGRSGWSAQKGFYFMIFDRRERRWINPAMIITPMQETRPVQILSVELRNAQRQVVQSRNLTQGRYTVFVNAAGGTNTESARLAAAAGVRAIGQFAPLRIVCSVNGSEVGSLNFEAVSARDGVLMVSRNGLVPARQVYANAPSFEAAEVFLTRGQVTLEIIVQDINGVSRSVINRLIVN
jgi:hypothetical protein